MSPGLAASLRIVWRRNRRFWVLWVLGLILLLPLTINQYDTLFPDPTERDTAIELISSNPAMRALLGPVFDLSTKGGFVFWRVGGFTATLAALMAGFGIIRATRAEEEAGRIELLRSGPVSPREPLTAAVAVSLAGCAAAGALNTVIVGALGLPWPGSVAAGLAIALSGALLVGIGAVAAQVFDSARAARGWTLGIALGGMYVIRGVLDALPDDAAVKPLRWLVPLEWSLLARPFSGERWWVFLLPAAVTTALVAFAYRLEARRDHGSGLRTSPPGRPEADPSLAGAWGLARRLQRTTVASWSLGLLLSAGFLGSTVTQIDAMGEDSETLDTLRRMGGSDQITTAFLAAMLSIFVALVAVMAATVLNRLRTEEAAGRTELLLSTATGRVPLALSHLTLATVPPALVLVACGALLPVAESATGSTWGLVGDYALGAAGLLPGVLLVTGLAMAVIGWSPRLMPLVWAVLGWSIFAVWFSALFELPRWLVDLQPWGHLALVPRDPMAWAPFLVETMVAVALLGAGLLGYSRRSIEGL